MVDAGAPPRSADGILRSRMRSLSNRNYRVFALGHIGRMLAIWMMFTAQDWLVLDLSGDSAHALSWVVALQFTPVLLLSTVGGELADRFNKRVLLGIANAGLVLVSLILCVLVATDAVELWHTYALAALLGIFNAVEGPVRQAFVSDLVELHELPNALSLMSASLQIGRICGPGIAGLVISYFGMTTIFVVSTVIMTVPVIAYGRIDRSRLKTAASDSDAPRTRASIVDSIRYVRSRPDLSRPIILMFVISLVAYNFPIVLPVLAKTVFDRGPGTFGLLTTCLSIGAFIGAFVGSSRQVRPAWSVLIQTSMAFGIVVCVLGLLDLFALACVAIVGVGASMVSFNQATNQRIQMAVDGSHRGRVMSLYMLAFLGTTPLGGPAIGALIELFGVQPVVVGTGALTICAATGGWLLERLRPAPTVTPAGPETSEKNNQAQEETGMTDTGTKER